MSRSKDWERFWNNKSSESISDFEYDRGRSPRESKLEDLSSAELVSFIGANPTDVLLDAGCGTGANILKMYSRVSRVVAIDYTEGAIARCKQRVSEMGIRNTEVRRGTITQLELERASVDKVICLSVLQYLDDDQVRLALREFRRVLRHSGVLVLHVKNLSSLYISSLLLGKKLKALCGRGAKIEFYRPFKWYVRELSMAGFELIDYNSFNVFMLEGMPKRLLLFLQRLELTHYQSSFFRLNLVRSRGSDLKLKARVRE